MDNELTRQQSENDLNQKDRVAIIGSGNWCLFVFTRDF